MEKESQTPDNTEAVRILLVEDNPDHAFITTTVVKQVLGDSIELIHAENADEAIYLIHQFTDEDRSDLILVDLRLPDNGGFAVLSTAKAHTACANVPLMVITSSEYDRDVAECYNLGASAVLPKPLSRARFREELARVGMLRAANKETHLASRQ